MNTSDVQEREQLRTAMEMAGLNPDWEVEWAEIAKRRHRNARRLVRLGLFILALNWAHLGTAVWSKWPGWWVHVVWFVGCIFIIKSLFHLDEGGEWDRRGLQGEFMWRAFTTVCWAWFGVSFLVWLRLFVLYGGIYKAE